MIYKNISNCRICGSTKLVEILNFGRQYLSSSFVKSNSSEPLAKIKIPLSVLLCRNCNLVQLREAIDPNFIYRNYFFRSATNPMVRQALKEAARDVLSKVKMGSSDLVLDTGCNDGTMFAYFPPTIKKIGIDPATNIKPVPMDKNSKIIVDYFSKNAIVKNLGPVRFKIITSIAMFYDISNPSAFIQDIKSLLSPDGVWCIQVSYLPSSIKALNFYDTCHEHLEYYTLSVLKYLMAKNDMRIFDASLNDFNGGSLRIFVTHKRSRLPTSDNLRKILKEEKKMKLNKVSTYRNFVKKIMDLKRITREFLKEEKLRGEIIGLGASTKGNVLLQFFDIDKSMLPYIGDRNPEKVGLLTLGTDIKLISEKDARQMNPSAMLVLIWPFKKEIVKRERMYLDQGGKLFFPMPYPHVVTKGGETKLRG